MSWRYVHIAALRMKELWIQRFAIIEEEGGIDGRRLQQFISLEERNEGSLVSSFSLLWGRLPYVGFVDISRKQLYSLTSLESRMNATYDYLLHSFWCLLCINLKMAGDCDCLVRRRRVNMKLYRQEIIRQAV